MLQALFAKRQVRNTELRRHLKYSAFQAHVVKLGRAGEEPLAHERANLLAARRTDLAEHIRWVSHVDGDGTGYDILSFKTDGSDRLIEVKTTHGWERTPFHITRNKLAVAEERRGNWRLVRLWIFAQEPKAFELWPPWRPMSGCPQ